MQKLKPDATAKYETVIESRADVAKAFDFSDGIEVVSKSAMHEAVMCGLYEPTTYDPIKGTLTIPISGGHYEAIHGLCATLNQSEAEVFQTLLEDAIEGNISGHLPYDIGQAYRAAYFDSKREPYVLTWAKQRTKDLEAKES
jgi:hypothetical protein